MNEEKFEEILTKTIVEYYIYLKYNIEYLGNFGGLFFDRPAFYYRYNQLNELFISNKLEINNSILLNKKQLYKLNIIIDSIKNNKFNFREFILNTKYSFILELGYGGGNHDIEILNPEKVTNNQLKQVNSILKKDDGDFYALQCYITYYYNNNWDINLTNQFEKLLSSDPLNPHILLKYSRYQASTLYKKFNKDKKYLLLAENNIINAINELEKSDMTPTYIYSWLGYIYIEQGKYKESILLFDKTIDINKKYNHNQSEPYIWKGISLNKMGRYEDSFYIYNWIENNKEINDKKDFRFYKILADNYYNLGKYKLFYETLSLTIKQFLNDYSFHFNEINEINIKHNTLSFDSIIDINNYESFLDYNNKFINNNIDNIIFSIAYLYKEFILGKNIIFKDSRGIEILCYNYLKCIYEGKIK